MVWKSLDVADWIEVQRCFARKIGDTEAATKVEQSYRAGRILG